MGFKPGKVVLSMCKGVIFPDKKDLAVGLILAAICYLWLGLTLIYLVPLVIACIIVVFMVRKLWKIGIICWKVHCVKKKAENGMGRIRDAFKSAKK